MGTDVCRTYLDTKRLKDSFGATDGALQLLNQSLHLFDLHLFVIQISIIVRIWVLFHVFNGYRQLYYLLCVGCYFGLVIFQLEIKRIKSEHSMHFIL